MTQNEATSRKISPATLDELVELAQPHAALIRRIVEALHAKKAEDVVLMDLRSVSEVADFFLIASGTSDMHIKSLADEIMERLVTVGERPWHLEGMEQRRWVLVDLVHVVVHLFSIEAREYYGLERLWGDARSVASKDLGVDVTAGGIDVS